MKILIVGGTGLIGGHAAVTLAEAGHEVTLMARNATAVPALAELPIIQGDYVNDPVDDDRLAGFDALVFAAAVDIRHLPQDGSESPESFYTRCNSEAVPRFFAAAKAAGIPRAVYIGSFYPQVAPHRIDACPYVRSRHLADEGVRALADEHFSVCSLNAPFVLGVLPGLGVPHLAGMVAYCAGQLPDLPLFAPEGGTNHIAVSSLSEAISGALARGESGHAYLVGDENLTWKEYLEYWCAAAGNPRDLEVRNDDHPLLPHAIMFAGPGATVSYEAEGSEPEALNYGRGRIRETIDESVAGITGAAATP